MARGINSRAGLRRNIIVTRHNLARTIGACLSLAIAALPAAAQDSESGEQSDAARDQSTQTTQSGISGQSEGHAQSGQSLALDTVVALVGDTEIAGAEVIEFISALPPRMRQQPPQMLMSMALDQVTLRELLLQEAQAQNFAEDPRVIEIADRNAQIAQEDAMVAVFLEDQLAERVSDEEVQRTYEQLQGQTADDQSLPPLDALRPQIERQLHQQAVRALRDELAQDVDVVVYGAEESSSQADGEISGSDAGSTGGTSGSGESQ